MAKILSPQHQIGGFKVAQFSGLVKIYQRPSHVAMVTKIRDLSRGFSRSYNLTVSLKFTRQSLYANKRVLFKLTAH